MVQKHFAAISDAMFEKELSRLIQPYSSVQVEHIAKCVGLDRARVERKLSQMILDQKFSGTNFRINPKLIKFKGYLQGDGLLVIFEKEPVDHLFELAVETIHAMGEVSLEFYFY